MIIEIHSILEVLPFLDADTHLFLDLDNTLLTSVLEFGSERWEKYLIQHFVQEGISEKEAIERACEIWKAVQAVSPIQLVETEAVKLLSHNPVFAITARDVGFRSVTEEQLASLNLQFKDVFYCGFTPKGDVLQSYIERHNPKRIVMVDDYPSHLEYAEKKLTVPFVGLRYGHLDERKANYKPCEVTKLLGKLVIHPEASQFLRKGIVRP